MLQNNIVWPAEMNVFMQDIELNYLGQRPWKMNSLGADSSRLDGSIIVQGLKYLETQVVHAVSFLVVSLFTLS